MSESPFPLATDCHVCGEPLRSGTVAVQGVRFHSGCAADCLAPIVDAAANLCDGWYAVGSENEGKLYAAIEELRDNRND